MAVCGVCGSDGRDVCALVGESAACRRGTGCLMQRGEDRRRATLRKRRPYMNNSDSSPAEAAPLLTLYCSECGCATTARPEPGWFEAGARFECGQCDNGANWATYVTEPPRAAAPMPGSGSKP